MTRTEPTYDAALDRDDAIIAALVAGRNRIQAAQAAGVSMSTVKRRLADPQFRHRLQAARHEVIQQAIDLTANLAVEALAYLGTVMIDRNEPTVVRMQAAKAIIGVTIRHTGPDYGAVQVNVESRSELERRAELELRALLDAPAGELIGADTTSDLDTELSAGLDTDVGVAV